MQSLCPGHSGRAELSGLWWQESHASEAWRGVECEKTCESCARGSKLRVTGEGEAVATNRGKTASAKTASDAHTNIRDTTRLAPRAHVLTSLPLCESASTLFREEVFVRLRHRLAA